MASDHGAEFCVFMSYAAAAAAAEESLLLLGWVAMQ
jgi:hypothetical protein